MDSRDEGVAKIREYQLDRTVEQAKEVREVAHQRFSDTRNAIDRIVGQADEKATTESPTSPTAEPCYQVGKIESELSDIHRMLDRIGSELNRL